MGENKKNRGIANISRKGLEITLTFCILLFGRMFPRIIQRQNTSWNAIFLFKVWHFH